MFNSNKSVTRTIHLNNQDSKKRTLHKIANNKIATEKHTKYLGVKFNRTLTYNKHLKNIKSK